MIFTCATCKFFKMDYGTQPAKGDCFGVPPPIFANGQHGSQILPPPKVRGSRQQCTLYIALEAGESNVRSKVTPETPADARPEHIAHTEALTARRADGKEYVGPGPYGSKRKSKF